MIGSLNPLELTGGPFLVLYVGLMFCALAAGFVVPASIRPAGRRRTVDDADELAVLTGGLPRLAEAVATRLMAADALAIVGRGLFAPVAGRRGTTPIEQAMLSKTLPAKWPAIERRIVRHHAMIERKLVADGLLMDEGRASRTRLWQTAPAMLLLALGVGKAVVGAMRDRPIGYLLFLLFVTVLIAVHRWRTVDRRTTGGRTAIFHARERAVRLRGAPTRAEAGMAVALFGTTVLAGSALAPLHEARAGPPADGGSGGGDSDSDSGGGCGGGCGGCGGD